MRRNLMRDFATVAFAAALFFVAGCAATSGPNSHARFKEPEAGAAIEDSGASFVASSPPSQIVHAIGVLEDAIDACITNVVSAESTAYKRARVRIVTGPAGIHLTSTRDHGQGVLLQTRCPTELAIGGDGFFAVSDDDGSLLYTRDGSFRIDRNGTLVTREGKVLNPSITVPLDTTGLRVDTDGIIHVAVPRDAHSMAVGQLHLARFMDPAQLEALDGGAYYRETPESGTPFATAPGQNGAGPIRQGFLELSNVRIAEDKQQIEQFEKLIAELRWLGRGNRERPW